MQIEILKEALSDINGGTFVGLDTETNVPLKGGKKNELQGRVTKKTVGSSVMVFSNQNGSAYEGIVKRRLLAEGKDPETFTVGPRAWGTRIEGTPFIEHKDDHYLEVIFLSPGKSSYYVDGKIVDPNTIEGLEYDKEEKEPSETSQSGLSDKVIVRTYKVSSITEIRANGKSWKDPNKDVPIFF